jgi:hypothetical protein
MWYTLHANSGHNLTILIRHKSQNFLFDHACHVDLHLRPNDRNGTVHLRHEYAPMKSKRTKTLWMRRSNRCHIWACHPTALLFIWTRKLSAVFVSAIFGHVIQPRCYSSRLGFLCRLRKRQNQVIYVGKPVSDFWIMISKRVQVETGWEPGLGTGLDLHVACSGRGGIYWNRAETLALYY